MKVVLIDGSRAGEVFPLSDGQLSLVIPVPIQPTTVQEAWSDDDPFRTEVYHLHRVRLFGEWLMVGSCHRKGPQDYDAFRVLMSDAAKQAVN